MRNKVLFAEDYEGIRESLIPAFEFFYPEFEYLIATNGKEAIEIFDKNEKDVVLVITDYNMPIKDGQDVGEHIFGHTCIKVLTSGNPNNLTNIEILRLFNYLIDKPSCYADFDSAFQKAKILIS